MMRDPTRRSFLKQSGSLALGGAGLSHLAAGTAIAQEAGERPRQAAGNVAGVEVLNPRGRVPLSFIIDDSTPLVNMAHFGIPQFRQAFPDRYKQDYRSLPREIPDDFVRKFADWCGERGVKGKYSVVPYPACVGWVDRFLPGWSKGQLRDSLRLIRERLLSNWDIHPEMVSHTRVVDIRTGRPYPQATPAFMENWEWSQDKSADELAAYMAYALRILKNADLPCEGHTTPGGFGSRNQANLARGTLEACRDVFNTEIPHYFRNLYTDDRSVEPRVYYASGLTGSDPRCVVSIVGCTGDWFGGWDGLNPGSAERFITQDLQAGRMVDVIERGEPAIMVCHWPGIYYNGDELGFNIFKAVVNRLHEKYDHLIWMKLTEIARYWAAKELTAIERRSDGASDAASGRGVAFHAPFASPSFTVRVSDVNSGGGGGANGGTSGGGEPVLKAGQERVVLKRVTDRRHLESGTFVREGDDLIVCFDLPKGTSELAMA